MFGTTDFGHDAMHTDRFKRRMTSIFDFAQRG